jgi:phage-related protein
VKRVILHRKVRDIIREFPREVRYRLGNALFLLQSGQHLNLPLSRPMPSVAKGAAELRFRDEAGQFRVFYFTADERGILLFHAFTKKTQQTSPMEIQLAQKRLKEMLDEEE